jgi:hypothetical protein
LLHIILRAVSNFVCQFVASKLKSALSCDLRQSGGRVNSEVCSRIIEREGHVAQIGQDQRCVMRGKVPFLMQFSNVFVDRSGRLYLLVPPPGAPNATKQAGGGRDGKGLLNDTAWLSNAHLDLYDVSGGCCDEIGRMPQGRRVVIDMRHVKVERLGLSLTQHHGVTLPPRPARGTTVPLLLLAPCGRRPYRPQDRRLRRLPRESDTGEHGRAARADSNHRYGRYVPLL